MKTTLKLPKFKIDRAKGVAKELERIHLLGVDSWVTTVAAAAGGTPWSGESLGSLRPVVEALRRKGVQDNAGPFLEHRINDRVIKTYRDWFALKRQNRWWRFHLSISGKVTKKIKTPELGADRQRLFYKFESEGVGRKFTFTFNPQIYQFRLNENFRDKSYTSPWHSFEQGMKAYNERVLYEVEHSVFLKDLVDLIPF
jgi:hypothetical protein